jgi:subtilisin family serine protease
VKVFARLAVGLLLASAPVRAATTNIAIIDSGVDYKHKQLVNSMWHEAGSDSEYPNDTNGWNFADNNNEVIDYSYLGTFSPDVKKYFDIQGKKLLGTATQEEIDWMTAHRADEAFVTQLETFGNFVHGTHVAGVSVENSPDVRAIPDKMIATKPPQTPAYTLLRQPEELKAEFKDGSNDFLIALLLQFAAKNNLALVTKTAVYANKKGARVANCSFGASVNALKPTVKKILEQLGGGEPTDADVAKWAKYLVDQLVAGSTDFTGAATNTLFVIAAGNDGTNNDVDPAWPANAHQANTISVAATLADQSLATFSNYGAQNVDVAAPGVVIDSTIPGDDHMALSGTSMAAPYVTQVAGLVAATNAALTPAQVRQTLISTVDKKDFLNGKVASAGNVNRDRAVHAARLSLTMPLKEALDQARRDVADAEYKHFANLDDSDIVPVKLPNPIQ